VTTLPRASITSSAGPSYRPMAAIRSPATTTSASYGGRPLPSTTVPPRITSPTRDFVSVRDRTGACGVGWVMRGPCRGRQSRRGELSGPGRPVTRRAHFWLWPWRSKRRTRRPERAELRLLIGIELVLDPHEEREVGLLHLLLDRRHLIELAEHDRLVDAVGGE